MRNPTVILLTIDCLRYDRCGFNGYSRRTTTRTLDSIASESYIFDRAYATGPWTPESFPGILAGRLSSSCAYHGDIENKAIPDGSSTIATHLEEHGYETVATVTNPQLSPSRNFDRGFERYRNLRLEKDGEKSTDSTPIHRIVPSVDDIVHRMQSKNRRINPYSLAYVAYRYSQLHDWPLVTAEKTSDAFIEELHELPSDTPIFGWVHFMDAHSPIHPKTDRGNSKLRQRIGHLLGDAARVCDIESDRYHRMYDNAVRFVDNQINRIIRCLKDIGRWDDTLLIVTSDHGEALMDRGFYFHPSNYMYDELLHVPLLVRTPDGTGRRIQNLFSLGWMHELIGELTEVGPASLPLESHGRTHTKPRQQRDSFVLSDTLSGLGNTVAVRGQNYKYIKHYGETIPKYMEDGESTEILFKYRVDPTESNPRPIEEVPSALLTVAENEKSTISDMPALTTDVDPSVEQRLRELGYR